MRAISNDGDAAVRLIWESLEGKPVQRIAGADGGPLQIEGRDERAELSRLTIDELRQLKQLMEKARGKRSD